eukprot:SAG31_NODE_5131_length_2724_cov_1.385143_3_plen_78_part_00
MNDWASIGDFALSDGSAVTYENWNPGEPQGVGERAVAIMLLGGGNKWADAPDTRPRFANFIHFLLANNIHIKNNICR